MTYGWNDFLRFSFAILDKDFHKIQEFDGQKYQWWEWYEPYGKKWYWVGPEYGKNFKSNTIFEKGEYFIKVYSKDNFGNYVLATGDIEKFGIKVLAKMPFTLPKINNKFWGSGCGNQFKIRKNSYDKMKKLLGILVLGLLKSYPIDYGRTITGLLHREIKSYFDLVKFLNLA